MSDARPNDLALAVSWRGDSCVLAVAGELDIATSAVLSEAVSAALDVTSELVLDLESVGFVDVRGVSLLVEAARAARDRGQTVAVRNWPASMRRIADVMPHVRDALGEPTSADGGPQPARHELTARR